MKPGYKTTEFWGKVLVQILTIASSLKPEAGIDPGMGLVIVGGVEALYILGRSLLKAFNKNG